MPESPAITWALRGFAALVFIVLLAPLGVIVVLSFTDSTYLTFPPPSWSTRWYDTVLGRADWTRSFWISLVSALTATAIAVVTGTLAAIVIVRGGTRWARVTYAWMLLPAVIPTVATAAALYLMFVKLHLVDSAVGIGIGQSVLALPLVVVIMTAALHGFDERLEQAAIGLGASPLRAFWTVTVPVLAPAVASASVFAFLFSFDEVVVTLFLSGPTTATLPVMIWKNVTLQVEPSVAAVSTVVLAVAAVLMLAGLVSQRASRRRSVVTSQAPAAAGSRTEGTT